MMQHNPPDTAPQRQERRDAVENRARILAVARRLFREQGVDATSMNQIAQVAQVGAGTLYRHFAHKGELCGALLESDIAAFHEHVARIVAQPERASSALERLEQLLEELIGMTESHIPLLTAMQEAGGMRRFDAFQTPFYCWLHDQITNLLDEAIARGEVTDLDVSFAADAIAAAIAPPLFAFQQRQRGFGRERIVAGIRRLFIDGLRGESQVQ